MFNLKKAQQNTDTALASPEMGSGGQFPPSTDQMGGFGQDQENQVPDFQSSDELRDWLDGLAQTDGEHASDKAIEQLQSLPGLNTKDLQMDSETGEQIDPLEMIKGGIARFFDPEMQNNPQAKEKKLQIAEKIFSVISGKDDSSEESVATIQQNVPVNIANTVTNSNLELKKAAQESVNRVITKRSNAKAFNLKTAQHKTLNNVIVLGPDGAGSGDHIDAFTGMLINDWHLIERNKGWGFKVDDKLNIDWESYWRSNIMDKFYRPYKDAEGNWVGGYLEGRFETDRNTVPYNNYQLKPGEKRRPYLPQYGLIEARLEDARDQMNKDRDYSPADKGKVFNWKEASTNSSKKKVTKIAFLPPLTDKPKNAKDPFNPKTDVWGDKIHSAEPSHLCPKCGEVAHNPCENCGMKTQDSIKQFAPDKPGKQTQDQFATHNTAIPVGSPRPAIPVQASASKKMNDIFFDGNNFVVYANSQKYKFADYYKAKEFKITDTNQPQLSEPKQPMVPPFKRQEVDNQNADTLKDEDILAGAHKLEDQELLERANAARSLGIDG